jgi:hypothetical protein
MPERRSLDRRGLRSVEDPLGVRLVGDGIPRELVEKSIESFEGGAADMHDVRGDSTFSDNAYQFTTHEWKARHRPPPRPDASSDHGDRS